MQSEAKTVAAYLNEQTPETQKILKALRSVIKKTFPQGKDKMAYGMPSYEWRERAILGYNAQKNYFSLYLCDFDVLANMKSTLGLKNCGKCCWRFTQWNAINATNAQALLAELKQKLENNASD
jgi:uncharacterized protein YdhG (YjbR/CyaY superfamily)